MVLYYLVDIWKFWDGTPFNFLGMNSILVYLLHEILGGQIPFCGDCNSLETHEDHIRAQVGAVALFTIHAYYLYNKKFFLSV
jgi:heparan-alpha-glucosaminide N-acetyltransferase